MKVMRHQRPGNFPIADMTQKHDHGPAGAQMFMNGVRIFRFDISPQFFRRHRPELRAAEETGAGPLEMAPANSAQFSRRFFVREGGLEIAPGEPAILRQEKPAGKAHEIPENKQNAQGKRAGDCRPGAIEKVNAEIEHAGAASRRTRAEG